KLLHGRRRKLDGHGRSPSLSRGSRRHFGSSPCPEAAPVAQRPFLLFRARGRTPLPRERKRNPLQDVASVGQTFTRKLFSRTFVRRKERLVDENADGRRPSPPRRDHGGCRPRLPQL